MSNISYESSIRNHKNHGQITMNDRNTAWSGSPLIRRNRDITFQGSNVISRRFFFKDMSMMNLGFAEIFTTSCLKAPKNFFRFIFCLRYYLCLIQRSFWIFLEFSLIIKIFWGIILERKYKIAYLTDEILLMTDTYNLFLLKIL